MTAALPGQKAIRIGLGITMLSLIGMATVYYLALEHTPTEVRQGLAQKIFYLHVPAAWSALLAFGLVGIVSVLYLWLQDPRLDLFAASTVEVGLVFSVVMLTTGPIWARPIWGTWWTWDPRLTLTLLLFLIFVGYTALRAALSDRSERARFSAVVGIMGLILVPFVHVSVYLFRTMHPLPMLATPKALQGDIPMPPTMVRTLLISFAVTTLLFLGFVLIRYGLALQANAREEVEHAA
jgi:heme exporter protein C